MRIGFDARLIAETGVGRYINNLLTEFKNIDRQNEFFIFLNSASFNDFKLPSKNWHKIEFNARWHTLKEQILMPKLLNKFNLDIMHFPYFNVPVFYRGKFILTVHDLIIDHFPTGRASTLPPILYQIKRQIYRFILKKALSKAAHILSISQTTKEEIIDHYQVFPGKITVTYDALDTALRQIKRKHKAINLYPFKYLLYVGNAYPHKNLESLCLCFAQNEINSRVKLVLSGDDWFFYPRLKKFVTENRLNDYIIFTGFADNRKLYNLYSFARALVIPSLMEGFGLPNLEAVYLGILPIVSDIPVFRELWKNDLLYFNPESKSDIKINIIKFLNSDPVEINKRISNARKRLEVYSWRETAWKTLSLYRIIMIK